MCDDVIHQICAVWLSHYIPVQIPWLLKVAVRVDLDMTCDLTDKILPTDCSRWVWLWTVLVCPREVVLVIPGVAVNPHWAVTSVGNHTGTEWAVDWNVGVVCAKTVSVRVHIAKQAPLQHLIIRRLDPWHKMRWAECGLLNLLMVVRWVSIPHKLPNWD
jgi:hypothetical protein